MKRIYLYIIVICISLGYSNEVLTLESFVEKALYSDRILQESKASSEKSAIEAKHLAKQAYLPRFDLGVAMGPAPAVEKRTVKTKDSEGEEITSVKYDYDFSQLGAYYGVTLDVAQPLNLMRLRRAQQAKDAQARSDKLGYISETVTKSVEYQEYFYGLQYALSVKKIAVEVQKEVKKALDQMKESVEAEDTDQMDLLSFQSSLFDIEEGLYEAEEGVELATSGVRFSLNLDDSLALNLADSSLKPRNEKIIDLDRALKVLSDKNPDLKRLTQGILARKYAYDLALDEYGPEFFIFGSAKFVKAWASNRDDAAENSDAFNSDPLNTLEGAIGLGARFNLNWWANDEKVAKARLEYKLLRLKSSYAKDGLNLYMTKAYNSVIKHKKRLESIERSMSASDAWLKGMAIRYDFDEDEAPNLLKAYKAHMKNKVKWFKVVFNYNLSVAKLIEKLGLSLKEYQQISGSLK
jgi:outer membrane protein TolC